MGRTEWAHVEYCGGVFQVVQDRKGHPTLAINFDDKTTQLFKEVSAGHNFRRHPILRLLLAPGGVLLGLIQCAWHNGGQRHKLNTVFSVWTANLFSSCSLFAIICSRRRSFFAFVLMTCLESPNIPE